MQQRRLRLGDILDDYCPRERRITNHAVVAMIEEEVRQTRCTTCDAEHEFKQAKVPVSRRRKPGELPLTEADGQLSALATTGPAAPDDEESLLEGSDTVLHDDAVPAEGDAATDDDALAAAGEPGGLDDDGPVHRRLIRATLPRPEGQTPERKAPEFTVRQPGSGRGDQRNGPRRRGRQQARQGGQLPGFPMRSGNSQGSGRPVPDSNMQGQRNGNRAGNAAGSRGGRPAGPPRGPRPGGGQGRKRGR